MSDQVIHIHRDAPPKPALGAVCNGCGVCCAVEPCSVSRVLLRQRPCPALEWREEEGRYNCGMMRTPSHYLRWLPHRLNRFVAWLVAGWLAAGEGCDSHSEILD